MLIDKQYYEAFARKSSVTFSGRDEFCCNIEEGMEGLICPRNWHESLLPREFVDMAQAVHHKNFTTISDDKMSRV